MKCYTVRQEVIPMLVATQYPRDTPKRGQWYVNLGWNLQTSGHMLDQSKRDRVTIDLVPRTDVSPQMIHYALHAIVMWNGYKPILREQYGTQDGEPNALVALGVSCEAYRIVAGNVQWITPMGFLAHEKRALAVLMPGTVIESVPWQGWTKATIKWDGLTLEARNLPQVED